MNISVCPSGLSTSASVQCSQSSASEIFCFPKSLSEPLNGEQWLCPKHLGQAGWGLSTGQPQRSLSCSSLGGTIKNSPSSISHLSLGRMLSSRKMERDKFLFVIFDSLNISPPESESTLNPSGFNQAHSDKNFVLVFLLHLLVFCCQVPTQFSCRQLLCPGAAKSRNSLGTTAGVIY